MQYATRVSCGFATALRRYVFTHIRYGATALRRYGTTARLHCVFTHTTTNLPRNQSPCYEHRPLAGKIIPSESAFVERRGGDYIDRCAAYVGYAVVVRFLRKTGGEIGEIGAR